VSCSPAFKWFLLLLFPLVLASIGWKLAASPANSIDSSDSTAAVRLVTDFLDRHHFNIVASSEMPGGTPVFRVNFRACQMLIALSSPRGWDRDMIRKLARSDDQSFVVFHGRVYAEQPMLRTVAEFLWSRLLGELGLEARAAPVVAVSAPPSCDAKGLPWQELR